MQELMKDEEGRQNVKDRNLGRQFRKAKKQKSIRKNEEQGINIANNRAQRSKAQPTVLRCNGTLTADKTDWLKEAGRFGQQRFHDEDNDRKTQTDRIQQLEAVRRNCILDNTPLSKITVAFLKL
jgi:hypothetical protein